MLYLKPKAFRKKNAAFFRGLYQKHLGHTPPWLPEAFPEPEFQAAIVRFRAEVFARLIQFAERQAALWGNRDQVKKQQAFFRNAGVKVGTIMNQREIVRQLRSLGGRKARLMRQPEHQDEVKEIDSKIRRLKVLSKVFGSNPALDIKQEYWHHLIGLTYTHLPAYGPTSGRRSYVGNLCKWLSIREIGLKCTPNTIKAANKRKGTDKRNRTERTPNWSVVHRPRLPISPAQALESLTKSTRDRIANEIG